MVRDATASELPTDENSPEAWQPPTFSRSNTDQMAGACISIISRCMPSESCVNCHKHDGRGADDRSLQADDLMAVVRVTIDDQETVDARGQESGVLVDGGDRRRLSSRCSRCGPWCGT